MPYIKKPDRAFLDAAIDMLYQALVDIPDRDRDGRINYVLSRLMFKLTYPSYYGYNRSIGILECVKQEFYRRVVAEYENRKIVENGEVFN